MNKGHRAPSSALMPWLLFYVLGSTMLGTMGWLASRNEIGPNVVASILAGGAIALELSRRRLVIRSSVRQESLVIDRGESQPDYGSLGWTMLVIAAGILACVVLVRLASTNDAGEPSPSLDLIELFRQMGFLAWSIAIILFVMSFWSIGVGIERLYTYWIARRQSRLYAPIVAKLLKEGRLKEAIAVSSSREFTRSHLAKVVLAGLQEYQYHSDSQTPLDREALLQAVRRSIQHATALTAKDLKRGVNALATIGSTAPFVGLIGTVVGVINSFAAIGATGTGGIGAISAGIAEALVETALGLFVAIPAVWFYNYLSARLEYFNVEMSDSSSELEDYLFKKA